MSETQPTTTISRNETRWNRVENFAQQSDNNELKDYVLLDSDSNVITFNNKNIVDKINPTLNNADINTNEEGYL